MEFVVCCLQQFGCWRGVVEAWCAQRPLIRRPHKVLRGGDVGHVYGVLYMGDVVHPCVTVEHAAHEGHTHACA